MDRTGQNRMALREHDPRDGEFNTPAEMLTRVVYLAWLASVPSGILLTLAGFFAVRWPLLIAGIAVLTLGWFARDWLRRRGQFDASGDSLNTVTPFDAQADATRLARLVTLLREWDELERRRGTPAFDPWAVQAIRNDIVAVIENDPALISLFRAHRHAA
jgi:hypothetical protein